MMYYLGVRSLKTSLLLFSLISTSNCNLETDFPLTFTKLIYLKCFVDRMPIALLVKALNIFQHLNMFKNRGSSHKKPRVHE